MTSVVYKRYLRARRNEDLQMTFGVGRHTTLIVNILSKTSIFFSGNMLKNNQSSVSDADREISILGSTDSAGNSVNVVSGITRLPRVGISQSASEIDDRFYFTPSTHSAVVPTFVLIFDVAYYKGLSLKTGTTRISYKL